MLYLSGGRHQAISTHRDWPVQGFSSAFVICSEIENRIYRLHFTVNDHGKTMSLTLRDIRKPADCRSLLFHSLFQTSESPVQTSDQRWRIWTDQWNRPKEVIAMTTSLAPGRPHSAWRSRWHIVDRAVAACTPKAKRVRCPPMFKPEKSKPSSIFPAQKILVMESASSKMGERLKELWSARANDNDCSPILSGSLWSVQVHRECFDWASCFASSTGWRCMCTSTFYMSEPKRVPRRFSTRYCFVNVFVASSHESASQKAELCAARVARSVGFSVSDLFPQIRWEKNITLGEPPGFLHSWWWWV